MKYGIGYQKHQCHGIHMYSRNDPADSSDYRSCEREIQNEE